MTTTTTAPRLALTSAHAPAATTSFLRLLQVELRKLVDTRASRWLLVAGVIATVLGSCLFTGVGAWMMKKGDIPGPMSVTEIATNSSGVMTTFLAILAIMSVTTEWTQRTTLTTFALEPHRGRVLAAKVVVTLLAAVALIALMVPLAYLIAAGVKAYGVPVVWSMGWTALAMFSLGVVLQMGLAIGFALLVLHTPAAIVLYFVVPMVMGFLGTLGGLWEPLGKAVAWLSPAVTQSHLVPGGMGAMGWWRLLVCHLVWVGVPGGIGAWRWLTREAK